LEHGTLIILITLAVGAYMAWNIGANDVANAMGTSVGSKAISLRNAMIWAAIANFCGAFLIGPRVSETIRGKIVDPTLFTGSDINLFVIGMLAALLASAIWIHIATYLGWPVSTSHAVVGAVFGFGLVVKGVHAIHWKVIFNIVLSWIISPVFGGILSALIFIAILRLILFAKSPILSAKRWIPLIIGITTAILLLSLFYKGLESLKLEIKPYQTFTIAICGAIIAYFLGVLWMRAIKLEDEKSSRQQRFKVVEGIFARMQIVSALYVAFAHGANDVANAIGPAAAVVQVSQSGFIDVHAPVARWLLVFGGLFIGLGTCTWGYKVIKTVGEKITGISPSRGFAAEFSTATTVLICSQLGLPISTTHTIVGAVVGVGLVRGMRVNLGVIRRVLESWLYTIPFSAILTVVIYYIVKAIIL